MAYAKGDSAALGLFENPDRHPRSIRDERRKRLDPVVLATWASILAMLILAWSAIGWAIDKLAF
jgi:hypothetical protein